MNSYKCIYAGGFNTICAILATDDSSTTRVRLLANRWMEAHQLDGRIVNVQLEGHIVARTIDTAHNVKWIVWGFRV